MFMKKFSVLLSISILGICMSVQSPSSAIVLTADNAQISSVKTFNQTMPYSNYLKFYNIDNNNLNLTFKKLSQEDEKAFTKKLTKEEKQDYKYTKKVQQLIDAGAWGEALYKYPNFYPALVQYYNHCKTKNLYEEALRMMDKIRMADRNYQIFSSKIINKELSSLYTKNNQYQKALEIYKLYENTYNDDIYFSIADCYYELGQYQDAFKYINKVRNKKYDTKELLFKLYSATDNTDKAYRIALELNNEKYSVENLIRLQKTSQNNIDRLKYAYQIRSTSTNEPDRQMYNEIIIKLEQNKINENLSKSKMYVTPPEWTSFMNQLPENISVDELYRKQDEFFERINNSILRRNNTQQLMNDFNVINNDYMNYVLTKKEQYYKEKQAEAEQYMREMQAQQEYLNQQLIQQQRMQNYIRMQHIQNLGNQSYYSNPLIYGPPW